MRKYLISEKGKFYKANLHSHSKHSDGQFKPEVMKEYYMKNGYSIIAYSDHDIVVAHPELSDENFLALTACEYEVNGKAEDGDYPLTCHFGAISLKEDPGNQLFWRREDELWFVKERSGHLAKFDPDEPVYERKYTPECINDMMKRLKDAGYFVTYNHPAWSQENYPIYSRYEEMDALEIMNSEAHMVAGCIEHDEQVYDDLLRQGKRVYCVAGDDNHAAFEPYSPWKTLYKCYTMIKAEDLSYPSVAKALSNGDFYASQGPVLNALYIEDGKLCVECEPVYKIMFTAFPKRGKVVIEKDSTVTYGECELFPDNLYIRVTLVDEHGKKAFTNAYFMEDILEKNTNEA